MDRLEVRRGQPKPLTGSRIARPNHIGLPPIRPGGAEINVGVGGVQPGLHENIRARLL